MITEKDQDTAAPSFSAQDVSAEEKFEALKRELNVLLHTSIGQEKLKTDAMIAEVTVNNQTEFWNINREQLVIRNNPADNNAGVLEIHAVGETYKTPCDRPPILNRIANDLILLVSQNRAEHDEFIEELAQILECPILRTPFAQPILLNSGHTVDQTVYNNLPMPKKSPYTKEPISFYLHNILIAEAITITKRHYPALTAEASVASFLRIRSLLENARGIAMYPSAPRNLQTIMCHMTVNVTLACIISLMASFMYAVAACDTEEQKYKTPCFTAHDRQEACHRWRLLALNQTIDEARVSLNQAITCHKRCVQIQRLENSIFISAVQYAFPRFILAALLLMLCIALYRKRARIFARCVGMAHSLRLTFFPPYAAAVNTPLPAPDHREESRSLLALEHVALGETMGATQAMELPVRQAGYIPTP